VAIDPDFAVSSGISLGSTFGAVGVLLAWWPSFPPSLPVIVAVAAGGFMGGALLGYIGYKIAQWSG
jgi:hypothetical protein